MSKSNTKYTVFDADGVEIETRSKKSSAVELADAQAVENRGMAFEVKTSAGTVVHTALRRTQGTHAAPWTKVSERVIEALDVPKGFTASYPRMRIPALVCRANDRSGWLIVTPEGNFEAKDTKEAREITNELGQKAAEARAQAREEAKAEKAKAREDAKAEKAEAESVA